jgi:hypothetical protein
MQSLDPALNAAIVYMASRFLPNGFTASPKAPSTYEELKALLDNGKQIVVFSGGSGKTIYGDKRVNYAFRAWHDYCHWNGKVPLTMDGEVAAFELQCRQLYDTFGFNGQTLRWRNILHAEVVGQAQYYERHKRFPINQRMFVEHYLANPEIAFINPAM